MKLRLTFLIVFLAFAAGSGASLAARTPAPKPSPTPTPLPLPTPRPIEQLSWLVGGIWIAQSGQGNLQRIETRYQWSTNQAFYRFSTRFVLQSGPKDRYDGNIYYDPSANRLMIWYIDDAGVVVQGPIDVRGSNWSFTFTEPDGSGNPANYRVEVVKTSADRYTWSSYQQSGSTWNSLLSLTFVRQQG